MSKGITVEEIEKIVYLAKKKDLMYSTSFKENDKILAQFIYDTLPEALEKLDKEKLDKFIKEDWFVYFKELQLPPQQKIDWDIVSCEMSRNIFSKFGSPKFTEADLERILPKEADIVNFEPKKNYERIPFNMGINACRNQILENFRRMNEAKLPSHEEFKRESR